MPNKKIATPCNTVVILDGDISDVDLEIPDEECADIICIRKAIHISNRTTYQHTRVPQLIH
jgi:hypothetical protein